MTDQLLPTPGPLPEGMGFRRITAAILGVLVLISCLPVMAAPPEKPTIEQVCGCGCGRTEGSCCCTASDSSRLGMTCYNDDDPADGVARADTRTRRLTTASLPIPEPGFDRPGGPSLVFNGLDPQPLIPPPKT